MPLFSPVGLRFTFYTAVAVCAGGVLFAATSDEPVADSKDVNAATAADVKHSKTHEEEVPRVPVAVARDRAKLLHEVYVATLHVMHDRYFHADRSIVPARAMEDVFTEMERQTGSKANWIAVNLRAMSINHEPKTDFEKRAAREIAAGQSEVEAIEDGFYRQATAISMTGGCISCHAGFFNQPSKSQKYSGLVISIPVMPEADEK